MSNADFRYRTQVFHLAEAVEVPYITCEIGNNFAKCDSIRVRR